MNPTDPASDTTSTPGELARVHYLPTPDTVDGEIVTEEEYRQATSQKAQALERYRGYRRDVVVAGRVVRTVATHQRTKTAGKAVVRNGVYVLSGGMLLAKRAWEAKTNSRYERMMRAAEAVGDLDRLEEWEQRAEQAKERRHVRVMGWVAAPAQLAKALVIGLVTIIGGLFALGIVLAVADETPARVLDPLIGMLDLIQWIAWLVTIAWGPFILLAPWLAVGILWHVGRSAGTAPAWVMPASPRQAGDDPITPSIVVKALRDMGITKLRSAIKEMGDAGASMLGPITLAGCGVELDVHLPSGVNTEQIQQRHRFLAENLSRHEHEVFITIPPAARTVRLWISDPGALDEPIGPSPLATDPELTADLYTGRAPWGQDLRGDAVMLPLHQRHLLVTGLSNQGKTAALRALLLWVALDPSVEIHLADLKGLGDWRMFRGLATTLIEGPTDEHVREATHLLEWGVQEMERRMQGFDSDKYPNGVPRELSGPGGPFAPIVLVVDEAQNAFMCPAKGDDGRPYGGTKDTSRYFMATRKIHNQGRAVNVTLWQGTQDPTNQNLPKLVREGAHIRASLVVGTEEQARMAVGDKAVNAGAAPHKLRQGLDKGTLVVTGDGVPAPPGQGYTTVRTNFIDGETAIEIADRAKARRAAPTTTTPVQQDRDLLDDVARVLGTVVRVKATDVAARLRELAPDHDAYLTLDGKQLTAQLTGLGVRVTSRDGYPQVFTERVHQALAERDRDGDETDH